MMTETHAPSPIAPSLDAPASDAPSTDKGQLHAAAAAFSALGAPQRLAVLLCLVRAGPKGLPIGVLGERVGVTGSTLTHHVKTLVQAGLVTQTREGRVMRCSATYGQVEALSEFLLAQCCADRPDTEHEHG